MTDKKWVADIAIEDQRVGYLYVSKVPAAKLPLSRAVEKAMPTIFNQLSVRGHDKPLTFKAEGCRWSYEPFLARKDA